MYQNENGEYVTAHTVTDEGGTCKEYRTYQNNGWTRINRIYEDGTTTETFERD